jgi:hypothetical protein
MPNDVSLKEMHVYQPVGYLHDDDPEGVPAGAEEDWLARVVVVDEIAGYVSCPDCMADERISDAELIDPNFDGDHTWARENGHPANCVLCKDTGKMWVTL